MLLIPQLAKLPQLSVIWVGNEENCKKPSEEKEVRPREGDKWSVSLYIQTSLLAGLETHKFLITQFTIPAMC